MLLDEEFVLFGEDSEARAQLGDFARVAAFPAERRTACDERLMPQCRFKCTFKLSTEARIVGFDCAEMLLRGGGPLSFCCHRALEISDSLVIGADEWWQRLIIKHPWWWLSCGAGDRGGGGGALEPSQLHLQPRSLILVEGRLS